MPVREFLRLQLVGFTHYFPKRWRGRSNTFDVRDELLGMFQYRVIAFFQGCLPCRAPHATVCGCVGVLLLVL